MSMMLPPENNKAPIIDRNKESWAVFHKSEEDVQKDLKKITDKFSQTHLIVSATYKFVSKFHDGCIYQINIVKAPKLS